MKFKEPITQDVIEYLGELSGEERIMFIDYIMAEYCKHCGRKVADYTMSCQCWNDE